MIEHIGDVYAIGKVAGKEVVQLYLTDLEASVPVPIRTLVGVQRIFLQPGERRQLTSHTFLNAIPTFSPDGRTLAYASSRTGDVEVWLHDLDSGDETRVTDSEGFDLIADWSPDGRRLLLLSQRGDGGGLHGGGGEAG